MVKYFFAIVLTLLSYSFAFDDVVVKSESMAKKLEKHLLLLLQLWHLVMTEKLYLLGLMKK